MQKAGMAGELMAEFLGTMVLIVFGAGVVASVVLFGTGTPGEMVNGGFTNINIGWGLGVAMGIFVAGKISGAHLNPAVTLALAVRRGFAWGKVLPYALAQTAGAFAGAAIVFTGYHAAFMKFDPGLEKTAGVFATFPAFPASPMTGWIDQIVGTALLVLLVLAITDEKNQPAGAFTPFAIGLVVVAIGMCWGTLHGYAINPARDLGPRLFTVAAGFKNNGLTDGTGVFWVPLIGPLIGGVIGAVLYDAGIRRYLPMVLVAALAATQAQAQAQAPAPQSIVLKAARLFDGRSDTLQTPGLIVVSGGRIESVGAQSQIPAGARVIDLGDATLSPGFMDAHTHLRSERSADTRNDRIRQLEETPAERAIIAATYAKKTLMAGFTTVRDLGGSDFIDVGLRNAINKGYAEGPRMLVAVRSICTLGGHCDSTNGYRFGFLNPDAMLPNVTSGADGMRNAVRWAVKYGADVIKVTASGGVLSLNDDVDSPQLTQEELNALVDEAHSKRKKAAAHAHGAEAAKRAIRAGIDSIEHGSFLDDEALHMMLDKGTYLVPTLMAADSIRETWAKGGQMDPRTERKARLALDAMDVTVSKAIRMGVKIAFGTDSGVSLHGRNAEEFKLMVARGMKPADALKAATSAGADLLGLSDRLGTLQAGKIADVVAIPGNPLEKIALTEKVVLVMKEGKVVRGGAS
ncbi:MAG: MIP family channel protein [Acidobacteriota bacterium]